MVYFLYFSFKLVETMILLTCLAVVIGTISYMQNREFIDEDFYSYVWEFVKVIFPFL